MKTITAEQRRALEDLSAQGLLGGLPLQTAEKDIHVTDLLDELSRLSVRHSHFIGPRREEEGKVDDGIQLVFAGGTSLSKAHRLISRMSEDIDVKVVLLEPSHALKKGSGNRARLKALYAAIERMLGEAGFEIPAMAGGNPNPHVRNVYRYYVVGARYHTEASSWNPLRPELKLELMHRHPKLPAESVSFGYMHEALAGLASTKKVSLPCMHVAETLAEKVLSFLRRCHWHWSGSQRAHMDPVLVRHVYDVHCIMQRQSHQLAVACSIFEDLVRSEVDELKGRDPGFEQDPRSALTTALRTAKGDGELASRYVDRLLPLIFEGSETGYAAAFASFEAAAAELMARI